MPQTDIRLGPKFREAFELALKLHGGQSRKTGTTPYMAHLLGVTALVLEDGGDEEEAIAALLHDGPEDQGGEKTLAMIRRRFGKQVAGIVEMCSDTFETPKPPWRERKETHMAKWPQASQGARRVLLADKLYNARTLLRELRISGGEVWQLFNGGKEGTLWYYRTAHKTLSALHPGPLADELGRVVAELERLA